MTAHVDHLVTHTVNNVIAAVLLQTGVMSNVKLSRLKTLNSA